MGTRLYPKTENPKVLESILGVPSGTYSEYKRIETEGRAELASIQEVFEAAVSVGAELEPIRWMYSSAQDKNYDALNATPELGAMDHFITLGWGKLSSSVWSFLNFLNKDDCGDGTEKPEEIEEILRRHGVVLPEGTSAKDLEGLYWC